MPIDHVEAHTRDMNRALESHPRDVQRILDAIPTRNTPERRHGTGVLNSVAQEQEEDTSTKPKPGFDWWLTGLYSAASFAILGMVIAFMWTVLHTVHSW